MVSSASLPEELWSLVVTKLPWKERIRSCSRVCSKLHRATAAATTQLTMGSRADGHSSSAELYLEHHGHHLNSLDVSYFTWLRLACANLQQLRLSLCTVQLGPNSNSPGILAACKGLTELDISSCVILSPSTGFSGLAAVPKLQHLKLVSPSGSADAQKPQPLSLPTSLLMHVPKLTCLHLGVVASERLQDGLLHLGSLTDLQSLSRIAYHTASGACSVSPSTTPGFSRLTALTSLRFRHCRLDPGILQHSTQLQFLEAECVILINDPEDPSAASAMLLSCIARMAHLEQLSLSLKDTQWTDDRTAYRALTASSRLQKLKLKGDVSVPGRIWQAMFPANVTCPSLQTVKGPEWDYVLDSDEEADSDQDSDEPESAATAGDLARLVSCCPALRDCHLSISEDESLAPLAQLSTLSRLDVERASNWTVCSLLALTQLRSLYVKVYGPVMPRHIVALSALRHLTYLHFDTVGVARADLRDWDDLDLWISSKDKHKPDVWLKLLKQCAGNQACQPLVIEGLLEQVASQAQLQELCLQQQQHIEALQQQSAQHQQRIAGLEEQVAQQQQMATADFQSGEAAELRGRVQALEGQVQQLMQALQHRGM